MVGTAFLFSPSPLTGHFLNKAARTVPKPFPPGMIFVPSKGGISHNGLEDTEELHLIAGARVLLLTLLDLADQTDGKQ